MNRKRLEFAAEGFLMILAREQLRLGIPEPLPKCLADYSPQSRSAILKATGAAIKRADPSHDLSFNEWLEKQANVET